MEWSDLMWSFSVYLGSAPASGAVGRALAAHCVHPIRSLFGELLYAGVRREGEEQQPRRLRSPFIPTAWFRLQALSGLDFSLVSLRA
jgi:hypothetical protein